MKYKNIIKLINKKKYSTILICHPVGSQYLCLNYLVVCILTNLVYFMLKVFNINLFLEYIKGIFISWFIRLLSHIFLIFESPFKKIFLVIGSINYF